MRKLKGFNEIGDFENIYIPFLFDVYNKNRACIENTVCVKRYTRFN